jgi:hypothetical protein
MIEEDRYIAANPFDGLGECGEQGGTTSTPAQPCKAA